MPASIDQLVESRIRQWQQQQQARPVAATTTGQRPTITISRAYGGWGRSIGELVAERLGIHLYDREIVERIASEANVRARVVESLDAKVRETIAGEIDARFDRGEFSFSDYLDHLARVVRTISSHEQAVIVGRGSQFILDSKVTLRVRAVAPYATRVERIAAARGLSARDARSEVARVDAERAAFCRWHFLRDVTDANHYDLVLNTGTLSVESAARLVESAFRARFIDT